MHKTILQLTFTSVNEDKHHCRGNDRMQIQGAHSNIEILSGLSWDGRSSVCFLSLGVEAVFSLRVRPEDELWSCYD